MKFDSSGMTRRRDTKIFYPKTEEEVFELLGLEYIEPMWRNADV
jgi:DNA polymerase IV